MSDARAAMSVPPRNAPCHCGSGRRYKECHGALDAPPAAAGPGTLRRDATLAAALAAQQAHDLAAAAQAYEAVLAEAPEHFDALHMLGVVRLQENRLEDAESLIARAVALRSDVGAARSNLALVRQARVIAAEEDAICRAVLPRLARLCADPPGSLFGDVRTGEPVHVVFAGTPPDVALAQRIAGATVARGAILSLETAVSPGPPGWPPADASLPAAPAGAAVIVVGLDAMSGDWSRHAEPRSMTLVATRAAPGLLLDRMREVTGQGRWRVALATHDAAVAAATTLPMLVLTAIEHA